MVRRADFEEAEWNVVVRGPALAAAHVLAVIGGVPPGGAAWLARAYNDGRRRHDTPLIDDIAAHAAPLDALAAASADDEGVPSRALDDAITLVARHAGPGDTNAYREFVLTVAGIVATSHHPSEQGSSRPPNVQRALEEIAAALDA